MEKLRTLFTGYAQFPPTAFIFCGNFLSACHGSQQVSEYFLCVWYVHNHLWHSVSVCPHSHKPTYLYTNTPIPIPHTHMHTHTCRHAGSYAICNPCSLRCKSYETFQAADVRQALSALGDLIAEFPDLQTNSKFIFVPGPSDPGPSNIFPRYLIIKF